MNDCGERKIRPTNSMITPRTNEKINVKTKYEIIFGGLFSKNE